MAHLVFADTQPNAEKPKEPFFANARQKEKNDMTIDKNQNPEQIARDKIDLMLKEAGWIVQSKNEVDLGAGRGVALREYQAETKFADYVLFVDKKPVGIIEAKKEDEGHKLTVAEDQALEHAQAKRILFLVDTKNLGEQAEQEFMAFQPNDSNRKFTEFYNVQRLTSSYIATDSQVCISTIQRMYAILKGEELDEGAEDTNPNESTWMEQQRNKKQATPVDYSAKVPIEQFDFIVIDECHRSIYNLWKQVLDYFDAFLIGLTATPDKRTFGFFEENVVSEYTYEESVIDGVNVPYDVYTIETEISKKGSVIKAGWFVDRRDKLTRKNRWTQEDEDTEYGGNDLDKKVVNPSQIRNIIRQYNKALQTEIFPNRKDENGEYEVPKTLIFAKTDSHADDIIKIVREEFNEGDDFCKKTNIQNKGRPKIGFKPFPKFLLSPHCGYGRYDCNWYGCETFGSVALYA